MTTDQLISLLAADLKPVDRKRLSRALFIAVVAGTAAAFGVTLLLLGPRPERFGGEHSGFLVLKLLFTSGVVATAAVFLPQVARPGSEGRSFLVFVSLPFLAIAALALAALGPVHWSTLGNAVLGKNWLTCLFSIPLIAIAPFVAIVSALRTGAPTDLTRAGADAGLVAGGLSAMACSLPCLDNSFASIAVWYGLTIGICTGFGAWLGPRLLRW